MSYKLIVNFEVREDKVDSMLSLLSVAKTTLMSEPGCDAVEVLQSVDTPNKILLVEVWDSKEIHDACAEKMRQAGSMNNMGEFLTAEPKSEFYHIW